MRNTFLTDALGQAINSLVGWLLIVLATTVIGIWLGMCIDARGLESPAYVPLLMGGAILVCLFYPQIFLAWVINILTWYLPLRFESSRLKLILASLNFITCIVVTAWVLHRMSSFG